MQPVTLAIAIPTYNRSALLEATLLKVLPTCANLGIEVYLSDDSSDDLTQALAQRLRATYSVLHYRRNSPSLGHDRNLLSSLLWADNSRYVWLLGDALVPNENRLVELVSLLGANESDFAFVTDQTRLAAEHTHLLSTRRELAGVAWHLTMTGATIYGPKVRTWVREAQPHLYPNFPQLSMIFGYCQAHSWKAVFLAGESFRVSPAKGASYWLKKSVHVFAGDWNTVVDAHPRLFDAALADQVVLSHAIHTGIFSWANLIRMRAHGGLTRGIIKEHRAGLERAMPQPVLLATAIACLPANGLAALLELGRRVKSRYANQRRTVRPCAPHRP